MESSENLKTAAVQRYVDVLTNAGFKALFGDAGNKDVVMYIINVLLPEHRKVVDIDFMPTEHVGQISGKNKEFHFDFMCRDASGTVFIVEMQRYPDDHWFKRCVSYACRAYDRQNRKGEDYDVPPVYLIGFMDVPIGHQDKEYWKDRYVSEYTFLEKECHDLLGETIVIIFAEMANFSKSAEECVTEADRMLYLLKNIGRLSCQPEWLGSDAYTRIFEACEIAAFPEDKRIEYDKDMYDERRLKSELKTAKRLGFESGHKEGLRLGFEEGSKEGRAAGHIEGLAEGRAEGLAEGRAEIIRTMYNNGLKIDYIAEMLDMDGHAISEMLFGKR